MPRLKGLYILDEEIFDLVYGPEHRAAIARHVDMIASPQTRNSITQNPGLLDDVELIFSGWTPPNYNDAFFRSTPKLKAIFHAGGGPACLPDIAQQRGVVMTTAHVANSIPVAEYALSTILFSLKHGWNLIHQTRAQRTFPDRNGAPGCYESNVGIVSLGAIARILLNLLKPFDLNVLVNDPFVTPAEADELGVTLSSLDEIFERSHVVSLHAPHIRETDGMITGRHLMSMRPGATFINTARGGLVREAELIEVAQKRPDLHFVLDVTAGEPPERQSVLYDLPNVILTPHIAGSAGGECRRMGQYLVDELERFVTGQPLLWAIPARPVPKRVLPQSVLNRRQATLNPKSRNKVGTSIVLNQGRSSSGNSLPV